MRTFWWGTASTKWLCHLFVILPLFVSPGHAEAPDVPGGYKLQPGDVLQVVVWKETDLQSEALIRPHRSYSVPHSSDFFIEHRQTAPLGVIA